MTLLLKYYDGLGDWPAGGGGIPDEKGTCPHCGAPVTIIPHKGIYKDSFGDEITDEWEECKYDPSEELARLKEENERLRGEDDPFSLHDVLKRLSGATKYLLDKKDYDGPDYEELEICILRAKEIIRELETTPSPTKK